MMIFLLLFPLIQCAQAGRPLFTDDAGVVGNKKIQLETWGFGDKRSLQHWIVPTVGIGTNIEISSSIVHGLTFTKEQMRKYAFSGPITQAKITVLEGELKHRPSIALAGGVMPPFGQGSFKTSTWEYYYYAASTYQPHEKWLIHLNLGRQTRRQLGHAPSALLWGMATEFRSAENQWIFMEATNGEIYSLVPSMALQTGLRHNLSEDFQIDATVGSGISGSPRLPFWLTLGMKRVFDFK